MILVHQGRMCILSANLVGHAQHGSEPRGINPWVGPGFFERPKNILRRDIANEMVSGKWATAKSRQRAIESTAACFVGRQDFCFCLFRAAVQVHSELDSLEFMFHLAIEIADKFR